MWTLLENARPPYNQSVFLTPGAVPCREEKSGRVNKAGRGTCSRDVSWRLVWAESAAAAQPAFSGAELCGLLPFGAQVLSVGDSISEQLLSSWRARLYTSGIDHRRPGMARWTVCGSPLRRFYHLEVWAWALSGPRFRASDSRAEVCAEQLRQNPAKFGLHMVSEHDLELKLSNATEVVFSTSAVALRTRKPSRSAASAETRDHTVAASTISRPSGPRWRSATQQTQQGLRPIRRTAWRPAMSSCIGESRWPRSLVRSRRAQAASTGFGTAPRRRAASDG